MTDGMVFAWAENEKGEMVHVDSVPNGKDCGCRCACCKEPVVARQGEIKEHGFAHHSKTRRATLEICYEVTLYKLAEHILQTYKRIKTPPYFGLFPMEEIEFETVEVNSDFEREDRQPDVIGKTKDGTQYLIEFVVSHNVRRRKEIDYKNMNCLRIDLSSQTLETLPAFLTGEPNSKWEWLNNETLFNRIPELFAEEGTEVRMVEESECKKCELAEFCSGMERNDRTVFVKNNEKWYKVCDVQFYEDNTEEKRQWERDKADAAEKMKEAFRKKKEAEKAEKERRKARQLRDRILMSQCAHSEEARQEAKNSRTCFDCQRNLAWKNNGNMAACGCHTLVGVPPVTPPETAVNCRYYRYKY